MSIESALCAHLKDAGTVSAIVGTDVYKTMCDNPDAGRAYIVVEMDGGGGHLRHMTGIAETTHRTGRIRCYQDTLALVELLARVVRLVLDPIINTVLGSGGNTANVSRLSLRAPIDDYSPPPGGKDTGHPTRTIPFEVWLTEAT